MGGLTTGAIALSLLGIWGLAACSVQQGQVPLGQPQRAAADESSFLPVDRGTPTVATPPDDEVVVGVGVGEDLQDQIDAHPEGTSFLLASGVHRGQSVIPRDGQRFRGEPGAVMSGAIELDPDDFTRDAAGRWYLGGQTQEGTARGEVLPGRERDIHPEELFVDGDHRLRHATSLDDLDDTAFFFDYDADRIYLGPDPSDFDQIETSVLPYAFAGTGVRDVVISNLVVEKYASAYQWGALGGDDRTRYTLDWTFEDLEVRFNHAGGLLLGPGATVRGVWTHHNGQHGMAGNGSDPFGNAAIVVVTDSEISHNLQLGFDWSHEGGGTKFSLMEEGMVFSRNYVHDNAGPGVWWDVFNHDVTAEGNLVVDNEQMGIFYEISYGDAVIADNVVLRNGLADGRAGIEVAGSSGVTVQGNYVADNGGGIRVVHDGDRYRSMRETEEPIPVTDVVVRDNLVSLPGGPNGFAVFTDDASWYEGVQFLGNRYHLPASRDAVSWLWDGVSDFGGWTGAHPEDGAVLDVLPEPPAVTLALEGRRVGPR